MVTLKIWHGVKHDDFTVTELDRLNREDAEEFLAMAHHRGIVCTNGEGVIPWHRINYFEIVEEEEK